MIDQYDQLQQNVKLHQAVLKGKAKPTQKLASLGMRIIIEKNKQIKHAKKQHLSRVILARKLKIKISQIFNIKNLSNSFAALSLKQKKEKNLMRKNPLMIKNAKIDSLKRRSLSVSTLLSDRKIQNKSYSRFLPQTALKQKNVQQDDGRINLFDNFTDEQLDRIEEDEAYYFTQSDLIAVFRKYMLRKRQNNKDFTYQKFSIKPQTYYKFTQDKNLDKRQYILNTLKIDGVNKIDNNQIHLLTNPIQLTQPNQKLRSKSLTQLRKSKRNLFEMFKDKQFDNMQKIISQRKKKILNIRIQRNYIDGVAAEIRAVQKDKKHGNITKKNKCQEQKSIACRMRVKTLREDLGKSIELAQRIRSQFLKRRTGNKTNV